MPTEKICLGCHQSFLTHRSDSKTCSARCRQRIRRGQVAEEHPCAWCGQLMEASSKRTRYHNAACKQKAYRFRRRAGRQLTF